MYSIRGVVSIMKTGPFFNPPSREIAESLRHQLRRIEAAAALDQLLPRDGFLPGSLIEWLAAGSASGAGCAGCDFRLQ